MRGIAWEASRARAGAGNVVSDLAPLLEAAVRTATPLLLASLGETVSERAGVINIGMEGCVIAGAYAAFAMGSATPSTGYGAALLAGGAVGLVLAVFCVLMRRDQIIVGTALTMLALGVTGTLFRARGEASGLIVGTEPATPIPVLSRIPVIGDAFFAQPAITYVAIARCPRCGGCLQRNDVDCVARRR